MAAHATQPRVSNGDVRRRRAASASMYEQRKPALPAAAKPAVDLRLRKLTTEALEQLKMPGAIPSAVIYAALEKAAKGH